MVEISGYCSSSWKAVGVLDMLWACACYTKGDLCMLHHTKYLDALHVNKLLLGYTEHS